MWIEVPGTGLWYIVYRTLRTILPLEQLVSDYGKGTYWHPVRNLLNNGVPEEHIVRCLCGTAADGVSCKRGLAFDRRVMDPHLHPETDFAAEMEAAYAARGASAAAASAAAAAAAVGRSMAAGRSSRRASH